MRQLKFEYFMKKDKCSPYHLYLPMFFWMIAVWIRDWSVWIRDWIKASWWRALLECGLVLFSPKTPVKTVVWPTTFPWGPHLLSVVHGLLEGLPTSQHLISHTSTSYICVRHTLILSLSLSLSLKALEPSQSLYWLDENTSLKSTLNSDSLGLFTLPVAVLKEVLLPVQLQWGNILKSFQISFLQV